MMCFLPPPGVSSGDLLKGVRYFSGGAQTQSIAMRGRSGTMRWMDARHNFNKLEKLDFMKYVEKRRWSLRNLKVANHFYSFLKSPGPSN